MELPNRNILLNDEVNELTLAMVGEKILEFNNEDNKREQAIIDYKREPIKIYINTPGGSVRDGFSIIDIIENSQTPVVTICLGKAYSMGLLILLAGHMRFASNNASAMMHDVSSGVFGRAEDIYEYTEVLKDVQDQVFSYIKERCKIPAKLFNEAIGGKKDIYFNQEDMIRLKIVENKLEGLL